MISFKSALVLILMGVLALEQNKVMSLLMTEVDAVAYLEKFGYFDDLPKNDRSAEAKVHAIKHFQKLANIPVTGELDNMTIAIMEVPRCGMKDTKFLAATKWSKTDLTYRFYDDKYTLDLPQVEVDRIIREAWDMWQAVANINIMRETNSAITPDIWLLFGKRRHGDSSPFDGSGGVLAHAYYPANGDAHFDDGELWTDRTNNGINLFQVAVHEFGHSLGLGHSNVLGAIMYPYYGGYVPSLSLHSDDIAGIQSLYGANLAVPIEAMTTTTTSAPTTTTTNKGNGNGNGKTMNGLLEMRSPLFAALCRDPSVDATVKMSDEKQYVFKGTEYFRLTDDGIEFGYPRAISEDFRGLPDNIDAALAHAGSTYFFKGNKYWKVTNQQVVESNATFIKFPGIPDGLHAAFEWSDRKLYFMTDTDYYILDGSLLRSGMIKDWPGIPNNLNAALKHTDGSIYFFQGYNYYRFDEITEAVAQDNPPYPRSTAEDWFGC